MDSDLFVTGTEKIQPGNPAFPKLLLWDNPGINSFIDLPPDKSDGLGLNSLNK
jgi:hypothetical protein